MTVEFRCADVGVACRKVTRAESADDLVQAVARHAREKHGVELNETLIDYAKTQVRTKE
jgi:predicted small metal-binding protein